MRSHKSVVTCVFTFLAAGLLSASPITYSVAVNTASVAGTAGSLDFNFNPGPLMTQPASVQILNFKSDGSLAPCASNVQGFCQTGNVSGQLPATVTLDNGAGFNDYFDGFTFGERISFDLTMYGPALSSPDRVSTSGSTLVFSMFSDGAGTSSVLTRDLTDGWALTINANLDGTTTVNNLSTETTVEVATATPEPNTFFCMTLVLCAGWVTIRFRRRRAC